jgi:hypothetical protein
MKTTAYTVLREAATQVEFNGTEWTMLINAAKHLKANAARRRKNRYARERYSALKSLGMRPTPWGWE